MKRLLVIFLFLLTSFITYSQTGVGYVNYTSYKTHAGYGATNQYGAFPYSKAEFDNMLNTANSNTTITHTGEVPFLYVYNGSSPQVPHWGGDYYAIVFDYWFIPQETGTYTFAITSDDASDFSVDGTTLITFYGGHGAGQWVYGQKQMVAGQRYKIVARYQEFGGGDALYVRWARPSSNGVYSYWNAEVTNIANEPTKKARMNFDFGSTLDKTKFNIGSALSSTGWIDITNQLDSNKVETGNKATITPSNWESVIINPYESNIGGHRLMLDERMFNSSSPKFNTINSIKVLDIYDGPVSVYDTTGWWKTYLIPTNVADKITASSYQNYLRLQDGWYAIQAGTNISYTPTTAYKTQSVTMTTTNTLSTLYSSIVTVSDVYLAFKELANGGIFGNQTGNEFTYGIQYKNADVNDDGYFNEADCFRLLQHLTGTKNLVDTFNLRKTLKLMTPTQYNTIGKSNWNTSPSYLGDTYTFDINTGKAIDTLNLVGTWKGDVNLSHSATPASNGITTMSVRTMSTSLSNEINASILSELIGDSIYVYVTIDPIGQELVGTQLQLNYDNSLLNFNNISYKTKGTPTNYGTDKGTYINFGSLITNGGILDNTTEYKIVFTAKTKLDNVLGLISVYFMDAINKSGTTLKIKMQ